MKTMKMPIPTGRSNERDLIDAKFDAIFAAVRHCSKEKVWARIQLIHQLLENENDIEIVEAVNRMESLLERLQSFGTGSRSQVYRRARGQLLSSWRYVMRGDYSQACKFLEVAADCCRDMD
jgi:hypothetical protein